MRRINLRRIKLLHTQKKMNVDVIVGPEARGFIIGCPVAYSLGIGFAPVRKPNKLPRETVDMEYDLEYGTNKLSMHKDAIKPGQRVLITDDLLATGGTIEATIKLVEELGGIVAGCAFLIELTELEGHKKIRRLRPSDFDEFLKCLSENVFSDSSNKITL